MLESCYETCYKLVLQHKLRSVVKEYVLEGLENNLYSETSLFKDIWDRLEGWSHFRE